jgi:hypothetical protein
MFLKPGFQEDVGIPPIEVEFVIDWGLKELEHIA